MTAGNQAPSEAPARVCVTGASGYVGSHVARELLERGYIVRATVRKADDPRKTKHLHEMAKRLGATERFEIVEVQLLDPHSFDMAFEGCRFLCHVASVAKLSAKDPQREIIDPAVEGTKNALNAAARAGIERVVLTSSIAAVIDEGLPADHRFSEADWNEERDISRTPYTVSKAMAERAAWALLNDLPPEKRFSMVAINPTVVLGPVMAEVHVRTTPALARDLLTGAYPGLPNMCFSVVDVRDVARAHALALEKPELEGRFVVYNGHLWMRELADTLRDAWPNRKVPTRRIPDWLMYAFAIFDKRLNWGFLKRNLNIVRNIDNRRSREQLGLEYRPLRETIVDTGKSFEALGLLDD